VVLTDQDCLDAFNSIKDLINEGKLGEASVQVNALGEAVANELKAQKDYGWRSPEAGASAEVQEADARALEEAVLQAEESIQSGDRDVASAAVDKVHETTQVDAKVKLVEITKNHVAEAVEKGDTSGAEKELENLNNLLANEKGDIAAAETSIANEKAQVIDA